MGIGDWGLGAPIYLPREADKTAGEHVHKIEIVSVEQ